MSDIGFSAFVSSTSGQLETHRAAVADLLRLFGAATVLSQEKYPNGLAQGKDIEAAIESSDIMVCLVGHRFGGERENGESWTQWELRQAISSVQEKPTRADGKRRHLLVFFYDDANEGVLEDVSRVQNQQAFRKEYRVRLKQQSGLFYHPYKRQASTDDATQVVPAIDELLLKLEKAFGEESGLLHAYSVGLWASVSGSYRQRYGKLWREEVSDRDCVDSENQSGEFIDAEKPPLIADQRFEILMPNEGQQKKALHPQAFVAGLTSEEKAQAQNKGDWKPVSFDAIVAAFGVASAPEFVAPERVPGQTGLRLFFVSAGGVGKSVTLKRLRERIHASQQTLAIHTKVAAFGAPSELDSPDKRTEYALEKLAEVLVKDFENALAGPPVESTALTEESNSAPSGRPTAAVFESFPRTRVLAIELVKRRLKIEGRAGHIVLLIDELDHVDKVYAWLPLEFQQPFWNGFHVVVAGRPHALVGWNDGPTSRDEAVEMKLWRFIEPQEFTEDQSKAYLGGFRGKLFRHPLVKDELGQLVNVPRILMYVRTLKENEIESVRSPAEIYSKALVHLIRKALEERSEARQKLSRLPEESDEQHVLCVLSALAFQTLFLNDGTLRKRVPMFGLVDEERALLLERLNRRYGATRYSEGAFENDMKVMGHIATIVGNGILDDGGVSDTLKGVIWANRTVQQYLAAYWFARHASMGWVGPAGSFTSPDSDFLRLAIFYPSSAITDVTEDLNRFLAEMPADVVHPKSWAMSAFAWYDPDARDQEILLWSTEMIYRSWPMMHDIAGVEVDDWWDISYESLCQTNLAQRYEKSPHRARTRPRDDAAGTAPKRARAALDLFKGHFSKLLHDTSSVGEAVRALAGYDPRPHTDGRPTAISATWIDVPSGTFEMGTIDDDEHLGFPRKTKAHWNRVVDRLIAEELSPMQLATEQTPSKWFSGAQGRRSRAEDIAWLANDIFNRHLVAYKARDGAKEASRAWILNEIARYFRRRDEIPQENPQDVNRFVMQETPVLNGGYFAFAPGHEAVVTEFLSRNVGGDFSKSSWSEPGHPAIYISWFDAWAFAQWANWSDADGNRFSCRLPHEVEWEYACRFAKNGDGHVYQVALGQRYWWGDKFYEHPDSPEPEYPVENRPLAHVFPLPGDTRASAEAEPNGLGFKDMLGNVWEWSANPYDFPKEREMRLGDGSHYSRHLPAEGQRPRVAPQRAMRGGIWYYLDMLATCSSRFRTAPNDPDYKLGFRLVREVLNGKTKH